MNSVQTWGEAVTMSLLGLWERLINSMPVVVGALFVFLIGLIFASVMGKIITKIVHATKIDLAIEKMKISEKCERYGIKFTISGFMGELVKWFLVLVFLMAATNILGLEQVTTFLNEIILYIPNVIVATVILTIAFLLGNFVYTIVRGSTKAAGVMSATLLASISKWAIMIFGILAALIQLGIATSLVNTIFIGLVAAISLATGLAFGLGGKDEAARILKGLREEIEHKE